MNSDGKINGPRVIFMSSMNVGFGGELNAQEEFMVGPCLGAKWNLKEMGDPTLF